MKKTKVIFLFNESNEDLFAFFLDQKEGETTNLSYSHIGQHSACSIEYAIESRPATKDEYSPLLKELNVIGYNLKVTNP